MGDIAYHDFGLPFAGFQFGYVDNPPEQDFATAEDKAGRVPGDPTIYPPHVIAARKAIAYLCPEITHPEAQALSERYVLYRPLA
jgi:hypothetical protein